MLNESNFFLFKRDYEIDHQAHVTQPLPTIEEGRVLLIECNDDDNYDDDENDDEGSHFEGRSTELSTESTEKTSLIKSTVSSKSYTEGSVTITDTHEHERRIGHSELDKFSDYHSSTMTDFQASLFLPSLLVSSYSTVRQSYDHMAQQSIAQSMARRSLYGSTSVVVSLIEKVSDDRGASLGLTIFNLIPYLIGTSLFATPYFMAKSGYMTIIAFLLTALLADITSVLMVDSMYEVSPKSKLRKRVRGDYVDIANAAFGSKASKLMNLLLITHLFTSGVVTFVLLGNAMFAILFLYVPLSKLAMMGTFSLLVLPTLFVRKLSQVAYMSMVTVIALITGALATTAIFIKDSNSWKPNLPTITLFDWNYFTFALSMWLYTLIIHATLPQIEGSMRNPASINKAVHFSMGISTLIKVIYGLLGAFTFGSSVKVLVTDNVIRISYAVSVLVNVVVAVYALFGFPLFFFVVCDAFDSVTIKNKHPKFERNGKYHSLWILLSRIFLIGLALAIAIVVPYFGPLIGVLGSILGTLLVFVLPCLFHLKLKWKLLSILQKMVEILIIFIGTVFGTIGLYSSIKQLYSAIHKQG